MEKGFDPALGARPLKRAIQRYLEDPLSELLLRRGMSPDTGIRVDVGSDGTLVFDVSTKADTDKPS